MWGSKSQIINAIHTCHQHIRHLHMHISWGCLSFIINFYWFTIHTMIFKQKLVTFIHLEVKFYGWPHNLGQWNHLADAYKIWWPHFLRIYSSLFCFTFMLFFVFFVVENSGNFCENNLKYDHMLLWLVNNKVSLPLQHTALPDSHLHVSVCSGTQVLHHFHGNLWSLPSERYFAIIGSTVETQ